MKVIELPRRPVRSELTYPENVVCSHQDKEDSDE